MRQSFRDADWPPRAVTVRVLDVDGREVHCAMNGDIGVSVCVACGSTGEERPSREGLANGYGCPPVPVRKECAKSGHSPTAR